MAGEEDASNPQRRATWFSRAHGERRGKGARRPNPRTIPLPSQTPTGAVWVPAGPALVRNGQASGGPAVAGRVRDIAVGPAGRRAYIASADGGVWRYTEDHSASPPKIEWVPLHDGVRSIDAITQGPNALATGAIAVKWGTSPATDRVYIGTGEIDPSSPSAAGDTPAADLSFAGIGVRVSTGDPGPTGVSQEALNLSGHGFTRLVIDPDDDDVVWAASDNGLFMRPASGSRTDWTRVTDGTFPSNSWYVTDLAITGSGATKVVWAAFWHRGVWRRSGGTWAQVPGIDPPSGTAPGNMALAAAHEAANANDVYVYDNAGTLYRFDGTRFRKIGSTPPLAVTDQGYYDLGLAVRPGSPDRVVIGGQAARSQGTPLEPAAFEAMLFSASVAAAPPTWNFGFNTGANSAANDHSADPTFIGRGVHADIHRVVYGQRADRTPDPDDVWVACDGGVFRSSNGPTNSAFRSMNVGLSSIQFNHMASHPTVEAVILAGSQDNGVIRRSGDSSWFESPKSDGGGVVIDPNNPRRMAAQLFSKSLRASTVGGIGGGEWGSVTVPYSTNETVPFYAPFRTSPLGVNPTLWLYPTYRIWATADWGTNWYTLPSGRRPTAAQVNRDDLETGTQNPVVDLQASNATTIHAATANQVFRLTRATAPTAARPVGTWNGPTPISNAGLPPGRSIISLAVESASGPEQFYVGLGGSGLDHVHWFDGTRYRPTGLSTAGSGFDAPVRCLAIDPTNTNHVYAGTPIGVWHGVRTTAGATNSWAWTNLSNRLPEASVLDLDVAVYGSGAGALRILRAATHGRGMWELALGPAATPDPDVHVRMNTADAGRRHSTMRAIADPERMAGSTTSWLDSPDVRLRRPSLPVSPVVGLAAPTPAPTAPPAFDSDLRRGNRDRRRWNGVNSRRPVRFLQRNIARRGVQIGIDGDFGGGTQTAVQAMQRRYALWPDGVVDARLWLAITSAPDLGTAPIDPRQFAEDIRPDMDEATGAMIADATGINRLFVQVHARGPTTQSAAGVRVALLLAPLTGAPLAAPTLPNGWAAKIRAGDTNWVGASGWVQPGGASPYRSPPGDLSDRGPEIVEWNLDFNALGFAAGTQLVALVAVHTTDQPFTTGERNAKTAVETLTSVAARRLRVDAVTAIPAP